MLSSWDREVAGVGTSLVLFFSILCCKLEAGGYFFLLLLLNLNHGGNVLNLLTEIELIK